MRNGTHDLEPIGPSTTQQQYLEHKASQCADQTVQSHRYRTNHFVRWCDENGIDNMNTLTGRDIHQYRLWRAEEGDLNKVTIMTQMSTIRVFLDWCGSIEAVDPDLHTKVLVPQVSGDEERSDAMLESERAEEILAYPTKFHYASLEHVLLAILWQTGMRIGAARLLDLKDIDFDDQFLDLSHRPETGTPLKNASGGERPVAISSELAELIQDYIERDLFRRQKLEA